VSTGRAASVQARLLAGAKARSEEFNLTLTRYALERFLYRISVSPGRDQLWLKGAMLFSLWFETPHRPTRDADFLGLGNMDASALAEVVAAACAVKVDDGMTFDTASMTIEEIREDAHYGGLRVRFLGQLGTARCSVQLDVGYGDAVTPGPEDIEYPTLLDELPAPRLKAYPRVTVVAEKLEAIVHLGMANSRMKDYFDLLALVREGALQLELLAKAIAATFARRRTALPVDVPLGLSNAFAHDETKRKQWRAFLQRNKLEGPELDQVVNELRDYFAEPLRRAPVLGDTTPRR
jgi:hypothetical protein